MTIHILLAVDANQVIGCAVSMRSIIANASPDATLAFHVMTNAVAVADRAALVRTVERSGRDASIQLREIDVARFAHLMRSKLVSHTTYGRLLLGDVLPSEADRCIYVDCDMVVERDIAEAWRIPLGDCTLAAVPNGTLAETRDYQVRLGLREARYFNAGFAVIDVRRWRERRVGERAMEHAEAIGDRLILHDQDAMNCALQGDWIDLPPEWNASVPAADWLREDSRAVFHYMGAPKPWQADYAGRFQALFLRHLDHTAYAGRRAWNPFGLGALLTRARRRVPYLPAVVRVARGLLGIGRGER